ncbi:hypothetical protein TSTA_072460 [Talaromyces stipitatus ATCC 10500]|uniref:Uncharacterized protein n=1 Tax=Talaromyces stipitatus (strain ATCC 10500 / CBS 375.48 / QM 6759 / NRRL 1006) TaxID=441959 RepID=B8LU23_TALSN|nr:uncharacterized protein TSTA_072460 [Talaromyces stipitatus ATCC 10500]EED23853.1 hypothetical protein TSTA_072460 [Talaromyces stipitatus ATCC 10500]
MNHNLTVSALRLLKSLLPSRIEDAVIIITASIPKIRPVLLVAYKRLRRHRLWNKLTSSDRLKFFTRRHDRNNGAGHISIRSHRVSTDDHEESSILHRLRKPNTCSSIYSRKSKPTTHHSSRQNNHESFEQSSSSQKTKHHRRHLSSTSGATKSSLGSHPLSRFTTATTGVDSIDFSNADTNPSAPFCPSGLANDFWPISSPQLTCQTVISAGDDPPPPPSPFASFLLPQLPPTAVTPSNSLTPTNGSGRSSRNSRRECSRAAAESGFTTTNSSIIFLPVNNIAGPYPILQTNHFSIEYEDENDSNQQQQQDLALIWADAQLADIATTSSRRYNEDDAEALQLHDVGCILNESRLNQP